jgi:hypothetical protein
MTDTTEEKKNKALPGHNNIRGREYYNKQLPFKFLQNEQH